MGHLVVPLKAVFPFWAQAANHPLPGDLAYADGSTLSVGNQAIVNGSSYILPDLRNKHIIGADTTLAPGEAGQYINYITTISANNGWMYQYTDQLGNATYTITSTDYLWYDVYWPSANIPASGGGCGAVDLYFSDGTALRTTNPVDQNGLAMTPTTDLRTYALNQWYTRKIALSGVAGKVFSSILLAHQPTLSFTNLTSRFRQIYIGDSTGNVKMPLWMAGDGTPTYALNTQSSGTFVSGNATSLTAPGPDGVSGTNKFTMKARHMPAHTHTASTGSAGDHAHSVSLVAQHSSHTHGITGGLNMALTGANAGRNTGSTYRSVNSTMRSLSFTGTHSHTVTPSNDGAHEHTVTVSTASSGGVNAGGAAFDTRPRYLGTIWCVKSGLPTARLQSIPMGSMIMWYADSANETLPTGFSMTDGSSLTSGNHIVPNQSGSISYTLVLPDTRNRYLIGADRTKTFGTAGVSSSDLPADAPGPGATGGTHVVSLAIANLPNHSHSSSSTSGNPWAAHNHSFAIPLNGSHDNHGPAIFADDIGGTTGATENLPSGAINDDLYLNDLTTVNTTTTTDSHSHTLSITSAGAHSHTVTVNSTGSGGTWDGRIPFIGIVYLMRTNIGLLSTPLKAVVGFRSTTTSEALVPTDGTWALCDGSTLTPGNFDMAANSASNYVLPNFTKFFPLGADRTKAAANAGGATDTAADAPGPKGTAGTDTISVTSGLMPAHIHAASTDTPAAATHAHGTTALSSTDAGHSHTSLPTYFATATIHNITFGTSGSFTAPATVSVSTTFTSATQPNHTPTCSTAGAHTHTVTIPNAGSGSAMHQRPRHHGLVFYMKVKR